jgi:hypothetical protein
MKNIKYWILRFQDDLEKNGFACYEDTTNNATKKKCFPARALQQIAKENNLEFLEETQSVEVPKHGAYGKYLGYYRTVYTKFYKIQKRK